MADLGKLAVYLSGRAYHFAAERVTDRLMAEANTEDWDCRAGLRDQVEADARFLGRAGTGRQHYGIGIGIDHRVARHLVVAAHVDVGAQFAEIMHQVKGEAVVVVDEINHRNNSCFAVPDPGSGGRTRIYRDWP